MRHFIEQHPEFHIYEEQGLLYIKWRSATQDEQTSEASLPQATEASASAASGALSASVSLASFLRVDDNSLTAAAPCEPSAAASGAPSDVAATPGALMRVYGDGGDREDLSDFRQLAD